MSDAGLGLIDIDHPRFTAKVALQGAQLLAFQPVGRPPLLWLSSRAQFRPGKAIRGGIPLCWPWFGPHSSNPQLPAHGFARTTPWKLEEATGDDESVTLVFTLVDDVQTRMLWPHAFAAQLIMRLGGECQMQFSVKNRDDQPVAMSFALHSYFPVQDIDQVVVDGLDGAQYLDKVDDMVRKQQAGPVRFSDEVDRVYLNTTGPFHIIDQAAAHQIDISAQGCDSTIIWNPWQVKAAQIADMQAEDYRHMLCVECGNTAENTLTLQGGETHTAIMTIREGAG
ncbi:D-hexose-6-phosphate mutarotase [Chitinivorax sp. B]|uniref:D-hexose-6-phosphate mutarotase n=1 Tax=Chitinivorax sp. B TaxID=2502235 RepID=UPI0014857625|nr:D-hexose-6-phosphate mutarotase [Chitinivorax sp. B]